MPFENNLQTMLLITLRIKILNYNLTINKISAVKSSIESSTRAGVEVLQLQFY